MTTNDDDKDLTFDLLPNVLEEFDTVEGPPVEKEIERCRSIYNERQKIKRKKAIDIKPLYYEHMKRRDLVAKYPVYKCMCIYPKPPPHNPCQHIGRIILDRDILTKHEHISYLAQPKPSCQHPQKQPRCIHQRRYLPNCTTRINSLAHPKKLRVQHNWQDYRNVLSVRQATNLRRTLQRPLIEYTTIENAITFIHEERRLKSEMKNEALKRCDQIKRKLLKLEKKHISTIIFALYEVMKEFLINDQFTMENPELCSLCRVLENKIIHFCGFDSTSTKHVQNLIKTVAQKLAIWIDKFTSNCGFHNARVDEDKADIGDISKPNDGDDLLLPVDDFIPYVSPSISVMPLAGDLEEGDYEYEYEIDATE